MVPLMTIAHNPQQLADGEDVIRRPTWCDSEPQLSRYLTLGPHTVDIEVWSHLRTQPAIELIFDAPDGSRLFKLDQDTTTGTVTTWYPDDTYCACPVVPDDSIHAAQLSAHLGVTYASARHRLEHELWHHLLGIYVYGEQSSPVIWREAHGVPHLTDGFGMFDADPFSFESAAHEEWLVAALSHHMHGDPSYDYGARHYLTHERGIDVDRLLAIGRELVAPLG